MNHPLSGTYEKLKRANENIEKLESEIAWFFKESDYPVIRNDDDEMVMKAIDYHGKREIPPRFSVLAGEIIHHLRSCLDHVAWQLSDAAYRRDHTSAIEFPVFSKEPTAKDEIARYNRKIKGIANTAARDIIEEVQPYNAADPLDDPLWIVHDMDRIDKHRELVIVFAAFNLSLPPGELFELVKRYRRGEVDLSAIPRDVATDIKNKSKITPQVAFREFGKRNVQFVVPGLFQLAKYVRDVIVMFAGEFK